LRAAGLAWLVVGLRLAFHPRVVSYDTGLMGVALILAGLPMVTPMFVHGDAASLFRAIVSGLSAVALVGSLAMGRREY